MGLCGNLWNADAKISAHDFGLLKDPRPSSLEWVGGYSNEASVKLQFALETWRLRSIIYLMSPGGLVSVSVLNEVWWIK